MPKLSPQTVTVLDGDVRLVKRKNSRAWQAAFKVDGHWVRVTTKCRQLVDAKKRAREIYVEYQVRQKNGLPVLSKRFVDVARLDGGRHKIGGYTHEDAEVIAATVAGMPD